ncbi:E3 ubiquitin-protein ligase CHIP-like [Musca vetustissima]|uniref:E3 ubiquitin-protein ligase CHIP-like n=1 Tax=Musca vetustissima TaxID=27455 RepID=UPI002AB61543|nr:E3 ubiquitin-protein ligase CHIP-like [Musca vetustissima]
MRSSNPIYSTANYTDVQLKEQGNCLFAARKYDDAIKCYTKAIIKNPDVATYFTNRALCYLKLKRWDLSCQDCRRALDIEPNMLKAHFFAGQSLMEMELYDEAITHLQRAYDLSKELKQNFGDDITSQLRLARKKRWRALEEKQISRELELQSYVNRLIKADMDKRLAKLSLEEVEQESSQQQRDTNDDDLKLKEKQQEIEQKCDDYIKEVNNLFAKVDERRRERDVPDYLCGKISFEILTDPVITPSGITYERKDIEEHLQRVGHFDPVTRVELTQEQLIPNYAMKEVVEAFIAENEWALDY